METTSFHMAGSRSICGRQVLVDAPVWLDYFAGVRTKETDLLGKRTPVDAGEHPVSAEIAVLLGRATKRPSRT